jgi:hypothetical protein
MLTILLQMVPTPWRFSMVKDERTRCPALLDYLLASGLHTLVAARRLSRKLLARLTTETPIKTSTSSVRLEGFNRRQSTFRTSFVSERRFPLQHYRRPYVEKSGDRDK